MGRWSRLVAPRFVPWLQVPAGQRWSDVGCGSGALTSAVLRPHLPDLRARRRPERGLRRGGAASGRRPAGPVRDHDRRGPAARRRRRRRSRGWCSTSCPTRSRRSPRCAGPRPGGPWRRTSGTTAAGCSCCGCSGTWPAHWTPRPSTRTRRSGSRCANPTRCPTLWKRGGLSEVQDHAAWRSPPSSATSTTCGRPSSAGRGRHRRTSPPSTSRPATRLREELARMVHPDPDGHIRLHARAWAVCGRAA